MLKKWKGFKFSQRFIFIYPLFFGIRLFMSQDVESLLSCRNGLDSALLKIVMSA